MELIKINQSNGKQAVSARELYSFLTNDTEQRHFLEWGSRNIEGNAFATHGIDYQTIPYKGGNGRSMIDYALSIDFSKELCMMSQCEKGKQARQYFIDVEKQHKQMLAVPNFSNPAEAARAWADEYEAKQLALSKVKELEPKAEIYDSICTGQNLLSMGEAAKICSIGRNKLFALLRDKVVFMKNNTPYQQYIDSGYFEVKVNNIELIDTNIPTTYVTAKGLVWLKKQIQLWTKLQTNENK